MDRLQKNNKQPLEIQRRFTLIGLILALSVAALLSTDPQIVWAAECGHLPLETTAPRPLVESHLDQPEIPTPEYRIRTGDEQRR